MTRLALSLLALAAAAAAAGCSSSTGQCKEPFTVCSATVCADLDTDPQHCGACGRACAVGQSCVAGQCFCPSGTMKDGVCAFGAASIFAACFNTGELVALGDDLVKLSAPFKVGGGPQSMAVGGGKLLVGDTIDNALYSVDPTTLAIAPGGDKLNPVMNQVVVKGDKAYVVSSGANLVQVVDLAKPIPGSLATTRTVDEIPTSAATPPAAQNTNPSFAAFAGDKLYVTLLGTCDAAGDAAGNRLLELDVSTVPGKVTRELAFPASAFEKDAAATANSPRPAGLAAVGTKLFVAIGNLNPNCFGAAGPGYLAVVDTAANPLSFKAIKLPAQCRNPGFVTASDTRVYVSCLGSYGAGAAVEEALVVLDPATETVLKTTTFSRCSDPFEKGPSACKTAVPGRMTIRGAWLVIADNNAGRLLVTDLEGNVPAGREAGVELCPLKCPGGDTAQTCYQFVGDVAALPK